MKPRIVIAVLGVMVVALAAGYIIILRGEDEDAEGESAEGSPPIEVLLHSVDPIVTDLMSQPGERRRWVQVEMELVCDDRASLEVVGRNSVEVRNELLLILRSSDPQQIEGDEGMRHLRTRIITRINELLGGVFVRDVFFTKLVIQ